MWKGILIVGAMVIGVALLVFLVKVRRKGIDLGSFWTFSIFVLAVAASATFDSVAVLDGLWWSVPGALFLVVMFKSAQLATDRANGKKRSKGEEWLLGVAQAAQPSEPKVVDYSKFVLNLASRSLIHRREHTDCQIHWISERQITVAWLIDTANGHACSTPDVPAQLKAVA